jgi:hypothetical protein
MFCNIGSPPRALVIVPPTRVLLVDASRINLQATLSAVGGGPVLSRLPDSVKETSTFGLVLVNESTVPVEAQLVPAVATVVVKVSVVADIACTTTVGIVVVRVP